MGERFHPSFEDLSAYRDAERASVPKHEIRHHLSGCASCQATVNAFTSLSQALSAIPLVTCAMARPVLSAQLDGEASSQEAAIATTHLAGCHDCRAERAGWASLELALTQLPTGLPSAAADAKIRGLIRRPRPERTGLRPGLAGFGSRALAPLTVGALALVLTVLTTLAGSGRFVPLTDSPLASLPAGPLVASVSPQVVLNSRTNVLYSVDADRGVIIARDATTSSVVAEIAVGGSPSALALNGETNAVYVLDAAAKTVTEISGATNKVVATVAVPVTGKLTTLDVNQQSGQIVVASTSAAAPTASGSTGATVAAAGQLAVIDGTSRKIDSVRTVEVAATSVFVNAKKNRTYLLSASGTSVVDATTYAALESLPPAVAVAVSANGGPDALLANNGDGARVTFTGGSARADLPGRGVAVIPLPDGSFAVLTELASGGRITLVLAGGETLGSLEVPGSARQLTYDADAKRFISANGQPVAAIARNAVVPATASPSPSPVASARPLASPSAVPSASPSASASASPTPAPLSAAVLPLVGPPAPPAPIPGATVAAQGVYRLAVEGHRIVLTASSGDRIWFVDQKGDLLAIDSTNGRLTTLASLGRDVAGGILLASSRTVYLVDPQESSLIVVDIATGRQSSVDVPLAGTILSAALAPEEHVWLVERAGTRLIDFDGRTKRFSFVPLSPGIAPGVIGADLSGRVWVADAASAAFYSYEPAIGKISYFESPAKGPVTRIASDATGQVWFGTLGGELFVVNAGRLSPTRSVAGGLADLRSGGSGTFFLSGGTPSAVGRAAGTTSAVGPAGGKAIAVDSSGRAWVSGPSLEAFFIVDLR